MTHFPRRPRRVPAVLAALLLAIAPACNRQSEEERLEAMRPHQVELAYTVPSGMQEVTLPSSSPSGGTQYDIKLFHASDGCELRVVRLMIPKGDGTEDQDATYNMLGAIMQSYGIPQFKTNGLMVPGEPGPVPSLSVSGENKEVALRAMGRISNDSLQGYQFVYGCKKGQLDDKVWNAFIETVTATGFKGSLKMHG
ncbi:hypothetical protein ACTQ49_10655 [Luteococcus sp. Sow4_B9]|uniref:hypothetical protein n=1 Tax=Luteococcus sp. Sow4_B9 TaxID=3438792 RepID=UPI003F9D235C